mmetsp:Transcript_41968/g.67920  ORF Transcript_41968/g.67920 Transcript_41968/m.67920 type:complete len:115 (+) Transcript_41968:1710-2054(+)
MRSQTFLVSRPAFGQTIIQVLDHGQEYIFRCLVQQWHHTLADLSNFFFFNLEVDFIATFPVHTYPVCLIWSPVLWHLSDILNSTGKQKIDWRHLQNVWDVSDKLISSPFFHVRY